MKYQNIPGTGYNSLEPQFKTENLTLSYRTQDIITLSFFSLMQVIAAAKLFNEKTSISFHPFEIIRVIGMLYQSGLTPKMPDDGDLIQLEVTRKDVLIMIEILKLRIDHCEIERDTRHPGFNPDAYIGQKMLLIDLKEWLLIEEVTGSTLTTDEIQSATEFLNKISPL